MFLLKIKYMAVQSDNYQGGSGRPFEDYIYVKIDKDMTAGEMFALAEGRIKRECAEEYFMEQGFVRGIELVEIKAD